MRWTRLLASAVLMTLLVACGGSPGGEPRAGGGNTPTVPASDSPVGTAPTGPGPGSTEAPELVEPSPGMVDVHPVRWDEARVLDGRTVELRWWSGVRPCHVLDHVEVDYREETVIVTLFEGSAPADEPRACIELAVRKRVRVELEVAVGGRELVDGAQTSPDPHARPSS